MKLPAAPAAFAVSVSVWLEVVQDDSEHPVPIDVHRPVAMVLVDDPASV
jgi:hypothetical protein